MVIFKALSFELIGAPITIWLTYIRSSSQASSATLQASSNARLTVRLRDIGEAIALRYNRQP